MNKKDFDKIMNILDLMEIELDKIALAFGHYSFKDFSYSSKYNFPLIVEKVEVLRCNA
tara:strand:+ start:570 stop:743 length:174 start_codon:yes stop_codon:yes gene_type:complete